MTRKTYLDADRLALAEEMRRDPNVWAVGEDLGRGGVFGQYRGLVEEFGNARISDAPIAYAPPAEDAIRVTAGMTVTVVREMVKPQQAAQKGGN